MTLSTHIALRDDPIVGGTDDQMCDLFGDSWDFAPNATFNDLADHAIAGHSPSFSMPDQQQVHDKGDAHLSEMYRNPANRIGRTPSNTGSIRPECELQSIPYNSSTPSCSFTPAAASAYHNISTPSNTKASNRTSSSPKSKTKGPNLYDTLRNPALLGAPMMMPMSPFTTLSEGSIMGGTGMEWSPQLVAASPLLDMPTSPNSPQMLTATDANGQPYMLVATNRLKRSRLSPYMGPTDPLTAMGLMAAPYGLYARPTRLAKMPLTPLEKSERPANNAIDDRTMPLILPGLDQANTPSDSTPHRCAPASPPPPSEPCSNSPPISTDAKRPPLDANIEQHLRSFLQATQNLVWENVTVLELKRILRKYDLNATGKKAALMERIANIRHSFHYVQEGSAAGKQAVKKVDEEVGSSPDTIGSNHGAFPTGAVNDSLNALFSQPFEESGHSTQELYFA